MEKGRTTDPITAFEYITRNFHDACLGIKTQLFVEKKNIYIYITRNIMEPCIAIYNILDKHLQ
jgi:hypothetical protein